LGRLIQELDIDINQKDLGLILDKVLTEQVGLTKSEIKHEIKSNNFMTNKVLFILEKKKFIRIGKTNDRYNIKITKKGVFHIRDFHKFYWSIFDEHIILHYRFRKLPTWFEELI